MDSLEFFYSLSSHKFLPFESVSDVAQNGRQTDLELFHSQTGSTGGLAWLAMGQANVSAADGGSWVVCLCGGRGGGIRRDRCTQN